jgi:D-aminopeptidase
MSDVLEKTPSGLLRARGVGLSFDGNPGVFNAITDVPGISVGYTTLIEGSGPLAVGTGPIRTGVTAILPRSRDDLPVPVFAGYHSFNGNGEMSGCHFVEEAGIFCGPVTITNTHSCGVTRDATIEWMVRNYPNHMSDRFALPVSAETYDGFLNDINGFHVTRDHVFAAIERASDGAIEEGSVGGGTGMKAYEFKAGSGTASRRVNYAGQEYNVGLFVQANFGRRAELMMRGREIGKTLKDPAMLRNSPDPELSSIIGIIATDAPLIPHQLKRLARRCPLGLARTGTVGHHGSGDIFMAFSSANQTAAVAEDGLPGLHIVPDAALDPFFEAVVQGMEEAILNSLTANRDMTGRDGNYVPALPLEKLQELTAR